MDQYSINMSSNILKKLKDDPNRFAHSVYRVNHIGYILSSSFFPFLDVNNFVNDINYRIMSYGNMSPYLQFFNNPYTSASFIETPNISLCDCKELDDFSYVKTDVFTHDIIIGYFLNELNSPFIAHTYIGFISENIGYILLSPTQLDHVGLIGISYWNDSTIENYQSEMFSIIINIIRQVLILFEQLQPYQYSFGGCLTTFFNISLSPVQFTYQYTEINTPFTCQLSNFDLASLTFIARKRKIRLYYSQTSETRVSMWDNLKISFNIDNDNVPYYVLPMDIDQFRIRTQAMGLIYPKSVDLYSFIISLLLNPIVREILISNKSFWDKLWNILWFPSDQPSILQQINSITMDQYMDNINHLGELVYPLLINRRLKCEVFPQIFKFFSKV